MTRRRITITFGDFSVGGAEQVLTTVGNELAARGDEVTMALHRDVGPLRSALDAGVGVVELGGSGLGSILPLAAHLRRTKPDIALSGIINANVALQLAAELVRGPTAIVHTLHHSYGATAGRGRRRDRAVLAAAARALPRADGLVAVSAGVAQDFATLAGVASSRIVVAPNPVLEDQPPRSGDRAPTHRWLLDGETGAPTLVAAGRLTDQKGFDVLLDAFARVRASRANARLIVFGDGPDRNSLVRLRDRMGLGDHVDLPGWTPDLSAELSGADGFVLSSRHEGLPTVLIEALAAGLPIVATDCPSGPAEILDGGRYGTLVPVDDPRALADAIARALADPRREPPESAIAPYRVSAAVDVYDALFETLSPAERTPANR